MHTERYNIKNNFSHISKKKKKLERNNFMIYFFNRIKNIIIS